MTALEEFDKEGRLFDKLSSSVHTARKVMPQFAEDFPESERDAPLPQRTAVKPKLGKRLFLKQTLAELGAGAKVLEAIRARRGRQEASQKAIKKLKDSIAEIEDLEKRLAVHDTELPEDLAERLAAEKAELAKLTKQASQQAQGNGRAE